MRVALYGCRNGAGVGWVNRCGESGLGEEGSVEESSYGHTYYVCQLQEGAWAPYLVGWSKENNLIGRIFCEIFIW